MRKSSILPVLIPIAMAACPLEEDEGCDQTGCPDDTYCDLEKLQCTSDIEFADNNLEACVLAALGEDSGPVQFGDAQDLQRLSCTDRKIESLVGLEHLSNLQTLTLWENSIEDISPLKALTELQALQLGNNRIRDIAPLKHLKELRRLGLYGNSIEDIGELAQLKKLQWLNLDRNPLQESEPLSGLDQLTWLTVENSDLEQDSTLHQIENGGCQVYRHRPSHMRSPLLGPGSGLPGLLDGHLLYRVTEAGVEFSYRASNKRFPVIPIFAGDLQVEADRFVFVQEGTSWVVGSIDGKNTTLCSGDYADICQLSLGRKLSGQKLSGGRSSSADPILTADLRLLQRSSSAFMLSLADKLKALEPITLASPNQLDAGSCAFMANTGAMEILMNQHLEPDQIDYMGDSDLSERYLMNASDSVPNSVAPYFVTDLIYTFNYHGGSLLSRDYPFAASYICDTTNGYHACSSSDTDAYFSAKYSWLNELPIGWTGQLTQTPVADRTIIFIDPNLSSESIWNVGLMTEETIDRIKYELSSKQAPVILVYNHFLYWHANIIIGYDDSIATGDCPMVRQTVAYFREKGHTAAAQKVESHMVSQGGCRQQGVFFVRDSIYEGTLAEPMFDYSDTYNYSQRYSERVVELSYDWAKYLGNHAYTVHRRNQ